jgi:hypothetical protein
MKTMRKTIVNTAAALAAFVVSTTMIGGTAADAKVVVVQSASPALAVGSSYAWAPTNSAVVDRTNPALANEVTGQRLRAAIETALAGHGYVKTGQPVTADLGVSFHVVLKQKQDTRVTDTGGAVFCGWRGCIRRWPVTATVTEYNYTQGTLVIDLVDRNTGELVWRAASEKRVSANDVSQARLNAIVADMMKSLPR